MDSDSEWGTKFGPPRLLAKSWKSPVRTSMQIYPEETCHSTSSITMELELVNPDSLWEKFTCDSCHRVLSVNPIRVYPDKKIICGRCPKYYTNSMSISFDSIAKDLLFKCVNRFDGCRQLLPNNLVEEHEKNCLSRTWDCPLCSDSCLLPTYLLISHFKENHKDNILEQPRFSVCEAKDKMLLYNIDDHLFFITFKYNHTNYSYLFCAVYVGIALEAKKIKQKFNLYACDNKIELNTRRSSCDYFKNLKNPQGVSVKRSEFKSSNFIVTIELDLKKLELFETPLISMVDSSNFGKLQKIFLSSVFLKSNPEYSIDTTGTALAITKQDPEGIIVPKMYVTFQCCICFVKLGGNEISTLESGGQSFCRFCVEYYKTKDTNAQIKQFSVSQELGDNLKFLCKWNCNGLIPYGASTIKHEEDFCTLQPSKCCPVERCAFKGNSFNLRNHFEIDHKFANLYLNSTTAVIHINKPSSNPPSVLNILSTPDPQKITSWYFLGKSHFVWLKEVFKEDKRIFQIEYSGGEEYTSNKLQPAVIVFRQQYVDTFRHSFVCDATSENSSLSVNVILEEVSP